VIHVLLTDVSEAGDPEEVRRRNEEEFQRKLRGEYEVAQQRLSTIVGWTLFDQTGS